MVEPSTLGVPPSSLASDDENSFDLPDDSDVDAPAVHAGGGAPLRAPTDGTHAPLGPDHTRSVIAPTQRDVDASGSPAHDAVGRPPAESSTLPTAESAEAGEDGELSTPPAARAARGTRTARSGVERSARTNHASDASPVRIVRDADGMCALGDAQNDPNHSVASKEDAINRRPENRPATDDAPGDSSRQRDAALVDPNPLILPKRTPVTERIVETPLMTETMNRTLAVHLNSPIVVWTGPSRNGKTETAKWLVNKLEAVATHPDGFRAKHFQYGGASGTGAAERKNVLRSVHTATVAKLDEGEFRQMPVERLALRCALGLQRQNVQMLLVDEAGLLGVDGLRALVMLRDVASDHHMVLSIVLIGMDNLPYDLAQLPQIERRVHEWCYFEPYALEETASLVGGLMPEYPELTLNTAEGLKMIKYLHKQCSGLPGLLTPMLAKVRAALELLKARPTFALIEAAHSRTQRDKTLAERAGEARAAGRSVLELAVGSKPQAS
jgi:hypothetical protein